MKKIFVIAVLSLTGPMLHAQTGEDSVKAAVNLLFQGMKAADPATVLRAFTDSAILQTVLNNEGSVIIKNEAIKDFAAAISKLKSGEADEQIVFESIKIDGALAAVWTPYKLYYKGRFLHCGVDSYQLVRLNGAWKIQYLIDTRRKLPCD